MIRVNLLGEKVDYSQLHVFELLGFGALTTVLVLVCGAMQFSLSQRLDNLQHERQQLEQRVTVLKHKTSEVEDLEKKKKFLADKLITIANLKSKKQGPAKLLNELTTAVPERSWLTGISQKSGAVEITGIALDNQTVSQFMALLGQSKTFSSVELLFSRQQVKENVKMQEFSVNAKLVNFLDSAGKSGGKEVGGTPAKPSSEAGFGSESASAGKAHPASSKPEKEGGPSGIKMGNTAIDAAKSARH